MEPLPRRVYNRQLWHRAAAGIGWRIHLLAAGVALVPVAARHLSSSRTFDSDWPLRAGLAAAAFLIVELAVLCFRRVASAPHELYVEQWQKDAERDSAIAALREQVHQAVPKPRLVLTYSVESLKGFEDEVSNPPILLHNEGDTAAIDAQIEALQLSPLITVTFATVQRIAARDTATISPRVQIRTEAGGWELNHNERHFGLAVQRAHVELAHRNVKTQHGSRRWRMTLRYHDADGKPYMQNYDLILDVPTMKASTAFVPLR